MYLKSFEEMEKTSVFFMLKPVNAVYAFIITVSLSFLAIIIWAVFFPMDEVVKGRVVLRPGQAVSSIKCVTSGELYERYFENDRMVEEGELLFSLDTAALKAEEESYRLAKKTNLENLFIYRTLAKTIADGKISGIEYGSDAYLKSNSYLLEKSYYETVLEDSRVKLERERDNPPALRIPQNIIDLENQYTQTKLTYENWLNSQKIQVNEKIQALEREREEIETRLSELERIIKNSTIYAPISGRIQETIKLNKGDYVLAGEEILKIVPQNCQRLKAEIYIEAGDVARIKIGNPVKIKFPGLPPSRFGMMESQISIVPPDVSYVNGQTLFIAEAEIENPYLTAKNGQNAKLIPGITAEGRIIIDKSTVMQMVLRKLDFIN